MKFKMNTQNGFTIIELMAVIAIVSILTVVAMAAYADYTTRGKIGEGMMFAAEAKTSVTDYYYNSQNGHKTTHRPACHPQIPMTSLST